MRLNTKVLQVKLTLNFVFIILHVKHINGGFAIFYGIDYSKFRPKHKSLPLYRISILITFPFFDLLKVSLMHFKYYGFFNDCFTRSLL